MIYLRQLSLLVLFSGWVLRAEPVHWSFRPLRSPSVPTVANTRWPRTPVDKFILAQLEQKGLQPASEAEPRKLVRRIYFDLAGLPPTPEQTGAFLRAYQSDRQRAVRNLVDDLLASPHYGERWGRHWLDVARYADSNGQESDQDRPTAYHYRDFVIKALNDDLPFKTFVQWQLAGDEFEPDNRLAVAATGFIVAGTHAVLDEVPMEEEKVRTRFNEMDDMIATTGSALLGLTMACARCHNHKYDPIPTRDYYRILTAFNSGDRAELPLLPLETARERRAIQATWDQEFKAAKKQLDEWVKPVRAQYRPQALQLKLDRLKIPEEDKELIRTNAESPKGKELSKKFAKELAVDDKDLRALASAAEQERWNALEETHRKVNARKPKPMPTALGFADYGPKPKENWLLGRGDFRIKKERVELGFLSALTREKSAADFLNAARANARRDDSTQQRRALAEWLTDLDDGAGMLVARVIVNRVWQHHFGEGLVRTVSDFGTRGELPTHPELLEWLASELIRDGWRMKNLHRLIMASAAYLQGSDHDEAKLKADPDNRLLSRRVPLRIESEIVRDSMLSVSGTLNLQMFGPAFKGPIPLEAIQARNVKDPYPKDARDTTATRRRTIYAFHKRVMQQPLMQAFDGPDAQASCGRREHTTVAPQALALLNDSFIRARAGDLAKRLTREAGNDPKDQIDLAWRLVLARDPKPGELQAAHEFILAQVRARGERAKDSGSSEIRHEALTDFCQALFALNEFIYVD